MEIFLAVAFLALIIGLWAFVMVRFHLGRWTVILVLLLLAVLFAVFFQAEDEDPDDAAPATRATVAKT
jgi:Ca2+/Na+ antiporter